MKRKRNCSKQVTRTWRVSILFVHTCWCFFLRPNFQTHLRRLKIDWPKIRVSLATKNCWAWPASKQSKNRSPGGRLGNRLIHHLKWQTTWTCPPTCVCSVTHRSNGHFSGKPSLAGSHWFSFLILLHLLNTNILLLLLLFTTIAY